jgi:hypothetical protein
LIELLPSLALTSNIYEADGDAEKSDRATTFIPSGFGSSS